MAAMQDTLRSTMRSVQNQPHDEEFDLGESSSLRGTPVQESGFLDQPRGKGNDGRGDTPPHEMEDLDHGYASEGDDDSNRGMAEPAAPSHPTHVPAMPSRAPASQPADASVGPVASQGVPGEYQARDYANIGAPPELKQLFAFITQYKPKTVDLQTRVRPFLPEYVPSLGDMDEFLKVPRPDGKEDLLGLQVLDEPSLKQSDRSVLALKLKALGKAVVDDEAGGGTTVSEVAEVQAKGTGASEARAELSRRLQDWVASVEALHGKRPTADVAYSIRMPDVEGLMEAWTPEVEEVVRAVAMPDGNLPMDVADMVRVMCPLLDIPVGPNPIESLHVMFTLYLELKNNPFIAGADGQRSGGAVFGGMGADMLQL